jgi:hypothetical protein
MGREDYYRRKARELMAAAHATRDPGAADWLRAIAFGYNGSRRGRCIVNPSSTCP